VDFVVREALAQFTIFVSLKQVCRTAEVLPADKDLRDRGFAQLLLQDGADFAAKVVCLVLDRIEVDGPVGYLKPGEKLAHGPAEFTPFKREQHNGVGTIR